MRAVASESLLRALADEFKRRKMARHVEALRAFYAAHVNKRPRRRAARASSALHFSDVDVLEWARCLQVPPFESFYVVQDQGETCPKCRTPSAVGYVDATWSGGAKRTCGFCKTTWIEREFALGSKSYSPHKNQR